MKSLWTDAGAADAVARWGGEAGEALALRTYASRLLGAEPALVLHGGGNTSVKEDARTRAGQTIPAIRIKASGRDLAVIEPEGHPALDLRALQSMRRGPELDDTALEDELRIHLLRSGAPTPSLESYVHAFLPGRCIDHTHAAAILALTNRTAGEAATRDALGAGVIVMPYVEPGLPLARAAADVFEKNPGAAGMVWMHHGLLTWGETARASYEATIALVTSAEEWLEKRGATVAFSERAPQAEPKERAVLAAWEQVAPILRGALARAGGGQRLILRPILDRRTRDLLGAHGAQALAEAPPLTTDHLIRTRSRPLWLEGLDDEDGMQGVVEEALEEWKNTGDDGLPRVVLIPGLGAAAIGEDAQRAEIAADIVMQTLRVKEAVAATGTYEGLPPAALKAMEYRPMQQAKLARGALPLAGRTALVTGAAGAIGSGIARVLLEAGGHVALTDLDGPRLHDLAAELAGAAAGRVKAIPMDVTSAAQVAAGFGALVRAWGGIDLVVVNAGAAHVAALADLDLEAFRRLEAINVEGTLLVLGEAARRFQAQGAGGDIVVISTKNVAAPGARFGAYSATKAAAHQLGRIASLELAAIDVRVNMVAPDAVFGGPERPSGLWEEVGPDRMKARGLDAAGLREYYRERSLLKTAVTPEDVGRAVLFFAMRQTPTTGATLPVDGGLPDATPR